MKNLVEGQVVQPPFCATCDVTQGLGKVVGRNLKRKKVESLRSWVDTKAVLDESNDVAIEFTRNHFKTKRTLVRERKLNLLETS